jgi:hypothetical protein
MAMIEDLDPENVDLAEVDESEKLSPAEAPKADIDAVFEDWEETAAPQAPADEGQDGACEEGSPHTEVEAAEREAGEAELKELVKKHPYLKPPDDTDGPIPLSSADMTAGIRG